MLERDGESSEWKPCSIPDARRDFRIMPDGERWSSCRPTDQPLRYVGREYAIEAMIE